MKRDLLTTSILLLALVINPEVYSQKIDSTSFSMNSRLSFYSSERSGEMILHIPSALIGTKLNIRLNINDIELSSWDGQPWKNLQRLAFKIDLTPADYRVEAEITSAGGMKYKTFTSLIILNYKPNEVKTDRLTGGLIANKRQFFPYGFYCYSPVYPTLPEEEAVKGFNMMSPYQKIMPETFNERKAYMDRCAGLGMKVHYNLLSVSGGGGVGSKIETLSDEEKRVRLIAEIKTFRDHPALLAWYISDEPTGNYISPEQLEEIYQTVKENDPWHPVSIVFMAPFLSSRKYADALDIVMADPYPVPDSQLTLVGDVAGQLKAEFNGKKPVWMVLQAFGGGEWWSREPTIQEIRTMTYQAIIKGARGIQYFVRQGLNLFPKSTATWGECGRMAAEIAEMTPWILSDEETIPVQSGSQNILATSAIHNGQLLILAVNRSNYPQKAEFTVSGMISGNASVLFENRNIYVSSGYFSDLLSAFGSQAYLVNIKPGKDTVTPFPGNLIKDPGFEDISSPGIPASCYARNGSDRGATYFLDSREHVEGNHSVRLVTPRDSNSIRLRFFPITFTNGRTYIISIWAKTDPEQRPDDDLTRNYPHFFEISAGDFGTKSFIPDSEWKQFVTTVTIPYDNKLTLKTNIILQMPSAGVAWFDMLQVVEGIDIKQSINPELRGEWDEVR